MEMSSLRWPHGSWANVTIFISMVYGTSQLGWLMAYPSFIHLSVLPPCMPVNEFWYFLQLKRAEATEKIKWKSRSAMMCVEISCRKYRIVDFFIKLMIRDGYTCVVTGTQDPSHPAPTAGRFITPLVGAHILRRAIGEFNKDHTSKSVGHLFDQSSISRWPDVLYPV